MNLFLKKLWRLLENMDYIKIEEFKSKLKKDLKPQRYQHTMFTVIKAMELAVGTSADKEVVFVAALLHDCAKYKIPNEIQLNNLKEFIDCPAILHAPFGALVAEEEYKIKDKRILDAIKYHSTGRKGMSIEEMIVCLADAIEDSRDYPNLENIREATKKGIKYGLLECLSGVVKYESEKGNKIHYLTLDAIAWLKENL